MTSEGIDDAIEVLTELASINPDTIITSKMIYDALIKLNIRKEK